MPVPASPRQIEPDGRQPRELERTRSWHYSDFNLAAFMDLATLGERVGVELWSYRTPDGRGIRPAVDFMVPFAAGERTWPYDQITPFTASTVHQILRRGAVAWKEPKYSSAGDADRRRQPDVDFDGPLNCRGASRFGACALGARPAPRTWRQ